MNNFDEIKALPPGPGLEPQGTMNPSLGLRRDLSPREIPLGASPDMEDLRFEKSAFRKEFGDRALGDPAPSKILSIVEHKFIDSGAQFSRIIRVVRSTAGYLKTQIWNNTTESWEDDAETSVVIGDRYIRAISTQNVLLFAAKGQPVIARTETITPSAETDDFDAGNSLTGLGDSTDVTLTPSDDVIEDKITVNFSVETDIIVGQKLSIRVAFKINGETIGSLVFVGFSIYSQPQTWTVAFELAGDGIENGDVLTMEITEEIPIAGDEQDASVDFIGSGDATVDDITDAKPTVVAAQNDIYTFQYEVQSDNANIKVEYWADTGSGWTKYGETSYGYPGSALKNIDVEIPGAGSGTLFGIKTTKVSGGLDYEVIPISVDWVDPGSSVYTIDVHGYNLPTDADPSHGVEYNTVTSVTIGLAPISEAPEALWIEPFGDRVIALRDGVDSQAFSWTVDGDVEDWSGVDSGQIFLVDARNDPIDDLQAAAPLTSNILAVFRARSIMRAFESGNTDQSVGVIHWIENLGTESPWSVEAVLGGVCFLGHDLMVYMLTEQGPVPVGLGIHQELIERVTGNLQLVDAEYDPVFQEYYLGVPQDDASIINMTYIFSVGDWYRSKGEVTRWRKKSGEVQRYSVVSTL